MIPTIRRGQLIEFARGKVLWRAIVHGSGIPPPTPHMATSGTFYRVHSLGSHGRNGTHWTGPFDDCEVTPIRFGFRFTRK